MKCMPGILLLTGLLSGTAFADDGDLIADFGEDGVARLGVDDVYADLFRYITSNPVVDSNGAITYCATRGTKSARNIVIARVNSNGTPDTSFSGDGKVAIDFDGNIDDCGALAVQSDGKIVVAGSTSNGSAVNFALARLTASGFLDSTFGVSGRQQVQFDIYGSTNSEAYALAIQADGKILVAGYLDIDVVVENFAVARLLADGSYDTSFNGTGRQRVRIELPGGSERSHARALAIDGAGRILLSGDARKRINDVSDSDFAVARLLPDGAIDTSFGDGGHVTIPFDFGGDSGSNDERAYAMGVLAGGGVVLAGFTDVSATDTPNTDMAVARLRADGALETAFGTGGHVIVAFDRTPSGTDEAHALVLEGSNIIAGGFALTENNTGIDIALVRLLPNGARDPSFGNLGRRTFDLGLTNPGVQLVGGLALDGSRLLFTGAAATSTTEVDALLGAVESDTLFAYGME